MQFGKTVINQSTALRTAAKSSLYIFRSENKSNQEVKILINSKRTKYIELRIRDFNKSKPNRIVRRNFIAQIAHTKDRPAEGSEVRMK